MRLRFDKNPIYLVHHVSCLSLDAHLYLHNYNTMIAMMMEMIDYNVCYQEYMDEAKINAMRFE